VPLEAVERRVVRAVAQGSEADDAQVDADGIALRYWIFDLAFGLDRDEPLAVRLADGDVLHRAQHAPAVAVAQPAELRQEYAAVKLIELNLFRV